MNFPLALLLFLSGACSLIYQTTWLREFRLVFGASTAASAAVLAIFMGGLGAGSWLLGKRAERAKNPLLFYGHLEAIIAALAAISPVLIWLVRSIYFATGGTMTLGLVGGTVLRLLLTTLVIGLPAFCMGGTLPAVARAATRVGDVRRRGLAGFYGMNTLGAVSGTALSTFFLFEHLGNHLTLWSACLTNALAAVAAIGLAKFAKPGSAIEKLPPAKLEEAVAAPRFVYGAAAVAGFAFLLMELVWFRMLAPVLGGSTYTFGLILMTALFGMGLGSAVYAFCASGRISLHVFALVCALEALCIAVPYALGDRIAVFALLIQPLTATGLGGQVLGWAAITCVVVLPAAVVAGYQFPMLISLLGSGSEQVARQTGVVYAWNTAGAITGSLAGGFGFLPLLTAPGTWKLVVFVLALLCAGAALHSLLRGARGWLRPAPALCTALAAVALLMATGPTAAWRHSGIGAGREGFYKTATRNDLHEWANEHRRNIVWDADGTESSVAAVLGSSLAFMVNGKVDGSAQGDSGTQVMLGLLGAALHPNPKQALVVGLGTGSTAGWLADVPSMERVDVVELEPTVLRFARMCGEVNRQAMENPKVHITIGDAREIVQVTRQQYDVIASEPSNPYRVGLASLYTQEFYKSVASRLRPGGIFVQWVQGYEVDVDAIRTVCATLSSVFPSIDTFRSMNGDLLFVASMKPVAFDVARLRERLAQEPFQSALAWTWRTWSLEGLLGRYVGNADFVHALGKAGEVDLNTDDRTILEFAFGRSVGRSASFEFNDLHVLAERLGAGRPSLENGEVDWGAVLDESITVAIGHGRLDLSEVHLSAAQFKRTQAKQRYALDDKPGALALWKEQDCEPADYSDLSMVADLYTAAGDERALPYIEKLKARFPAEAGILLADLRAQQGRGDDAVDALEKTCVLIRHDPWTPGPIFKRGLDLALELATAESSRQVARRLHTALGERFGCYRGDSARTRTHLALAELIDGNGTAEMTAAGFDAVEPEPIWQRSFLEKRCRIYAAAGHPLAEQAREDFEEYQRNEGPKLPRFLPPTQVASRQP